MKLSEQLTLRNMAGEKVSGFDFDKALELEAEVERLRQQIAEMNGAYVKNIMPMIDNLSLHQAAVAEVRTLLARGPKYWAHADEFIAILDKLPKGEP